MKNKFNWTIKHIQSLIIIGLVLGIVGTHYDVLQYLPTAQAVTYVKEETKTCDPIDCKIEELTLKIFEANKNNYLEQARLDAISELNKVLGSKIDNSPYVDYQAMAEEYGYSE